MTNPDYTVGTNAGYNGRTTPNAFNAVLQLLATKGVLKGWACSPKSGMTVQIGGIAGTPDVAIAEEPGGNRTGIVNNTASPVDITIAGAPASNNRIDDIIAYVNNPQQGTGSGDVNFPSQTGIIAVSGTVASSPSEPSDAQIEAGITADGGNGATAYWVKLAIIEVGQGVTTITAGDITAGPSSNVNATIPNGSVTEAKLANSSVSGAKIQAYTITANKMATNVIPDFTLQTTDPGEGVALAANHFIGVYS